MSEYLKGYNAAVADALEIIRSVPIESWPDRDPYEQSAPTPSQRQARDVKQQCLDSVARLNRIK
jgi:hypothetical protein